MFVTSTRDILRAFSEGYIGWREATRRLGLEHFEELQALMDAHGMARSPRDPQQANARMNALDSLLYGHSGTSHES
jgi:hypothetical protein